MAVYLSEVNCVIYLFIYSLSSCFYFFYTEKAFEVDSLVVKAFKLLNKTQKILSGT